MIQRRENLHIKKDFMGLVAGDEVELIYADNYGTLHFDVINRTRLVRFNGNKKGPWSDDNRFEWWKKNANPYILKEELMYSFTAISFSLKEVRDDHKKDPYGYSATYRGRKIPKDKLFIDFRVDQILEDLRSVGVID